MLYSTVPASPSSAALSADMLRTAPLVAAGGLHGKKAPLPFALDGDLQFVDGEGPRLGVYMSMRDASAGRSGLVPLIVVHSVNAAASAAELRPIFERFGAFRPVAALDLPGFGQSERGALAYTPQMMTEAILRTVRHVRALGFTSPVDVMGVSLSCEFVARAAMAQPDWFRSVALVSPTGLDSPRPGPYQPDRTKENRWLRVLLDMPVWAQGLYRLLTSRPSTRYFLKRTWGSVAIDEQLLEYNLLTARQPGARHAPFAFVCGALFTPGIAHLYAALPQPVWIAHGVRGDFTRYDGLAHLKPEDKWVVDIFGTGALPYFEVPSLFASRYAAFQRKASVPVEAGQWRSRISLGSLYPCETVAGR